jgi:type I restriction enzyme S subunit
MTSDAYELVSLRHAGVQLIDCVHKTPPAQEEGVPYVTIPNLREGRVVVEGARRIAREDMLIWNQKCDPTPDDIILSRRCNPGVTAVVPSDFEGSLGQNLVLLRSLNDVLDQKFFRWSVRSPQWWNEVDRYINAGAVFDSLRCADIPKFKIPLPPLTEQKKIAHVLGTLDEKIELNQKTNETFEGIAKALFKSWFVDFDPVREKAEGRPTGLPDEINELFSVSFEESELGEIPSGWSIKSLGDICSKIGSGQTPRGGKEAYRGGDYALIRSQNVYNEKFSKDGLVFINDHQALQLSSVEVLPGDILLNITGDSVARTCQVPASVLPARVNQHVSIARADSQYATSSFIRFFLVEPGTQSLLHTLASGGATRNALTKGMLETLPVVVPPIGIQQAFDAIAGLILEKQESIQVANSLLSSLRDTLLPKLMSGEIRVPDTEKLLEEAGI